MDAACADANKAIQTQFKDLANPTDADVETEKQRLLQSMHALGFSLSADTAMLITLRHEYDGLVDEDHVPAGSFETAPNTPAAETPAVTVIESDDD